MMNWFRKSFLVACWGCAFAAGISSAQNTDWRAGAPSPTASGPIGVSLGQPLPLSDAMPRPAGGIRQASFSTPHSFKTARGVSTGQTDGPGTLFLPPDREAVPPPKRLPIQVEPKRASQPESTSGIPVVDVDDQPKVVSERVVIVDGNTGKDLADNSWIMGSELNGGQRFYVAGEWLYWTARGFYLPPLVTTASPLDDPATRAALGLGTTRLLYGAENALNGLRPGARFTLGYNFDPDGVSAIEGNFFFLAPKKYTIIFGSDAFPVIGRPFFNLNTGGQDRELTTTPEFNQGTLHVRTANSLFGAEINKRTLLCCGCDYQVTGLVGFRYLDLSDRLGIDEYVTFTGNVPGVNGNPPVASAGDRVNVFDRFDTRNRFYGGQVGVAGNWGLGRWSLGGSVKLALGATQQSIDIDGGQTVTRANGAVQNFRGGLYALQSNIGNHSQTRFSVVPEFGLKIGCQLTDNLRLYAGYDFLYWHSVVRPGDQIDQTLDFNTIPNRGQDLPGVTQVRPRVPFHTSSFWAHGLNAGLEFRY
ncbi:MAG: BBP7 family outer membrane beta-barrel protein [Planctomycetes bacterium]|nr:BBP7 family outer membrane beta-barrel protein [Planctomycetota bacterium]